MRPSPRAKTLAHLQALVAAATATAAAATSVGCGKGKAEKKPDDPYGSSGYAVVDPLPPPTIEPPVVPPSLLYQGQVKVAIKTEKSRTVFRLTPAETAPDLVFDDVVSPATVLKREQIAKSRELVVTVDKTSQIVVRAHGEAGTFTITASADDAGAKVTLSQ